MSATKDETIELILDHLFTNGSKEKGVRLLLIQEDYSGAAKVSNARYLGGCQSTCIKKHVARRSQRREATGNIPGEFYT